MNSIEGITAAATAPRRPVILTYCAYCSTGNPGNLLGFY